MDNLQAFMVYFEDKVKGTLVLETNNIHPSQNDKLELSSAFGMWELLLTPNYSQGRTSETYTTEARAALRERAEGIFIKNSVEVPGMERDSSVIDIAW